MADIGNNNTGVEIDSFHLRPGVTYLVCGPSGTMKTRTVTGILENFEEATNGAGKIKDIHIW